MLTKRSTHVDQNMRSDKVVSQLSITIFVAPRTHLVAQKSLISSKKSKKSTNPCRPPPCLPKRAIYIYIYIYMNAVILIPWINGDGAKCHVRV